MGAVQRPQPFPPLWESGQFYKPLLAPLDESFQDTPWQPVRQSPCLGPCPDHSQAMTSGDVELQTQVGTLKGRVSTQEPGWPVGGGLDASPQEERAAL